MKKNLLLTVLIICTAFSTKAQIIHVPADHSTIQAGINAASDGDTVLVAEGTYYENIRFMGKAITLASEFILDMDTTHISNTIIDGSRPADPDKASVVMFLNGEDTTSVLNGFTITGGSGSYNATIEGRVGGGVFSLNSSCKIINNTIINNLVEHNWVAAGGGILCYQSEGENWSIIENNKFIQNTAISSGLISYGGGLQTNTITIIKNNLIEGNSCLNNSQEASGGGFNIYNEAGLKGPVVIVGNTIRNNTISAKTRAGGGGFYLDRFSMDVKIQNNIIKDNSVICEGDAYGGGMYLYQVSNCSISNNTLTGNLCEALNGRGAGLFTVQSGGLNIAENLFSNNAMKCSRSWYGVGLWINDSQGEISIVGNNFDSNLGYGVTSGNRMGGAMLLYENGERKILVDGNIIRDHAARHGAGIFAIHSFNMVLSNNFIINNRAELEGGGIKLQQNDYFGTGIEKQTILVNNTFIQNHAPDGGAISTAHEITPVIFNSIFWENTGSRGKDINNSNNNALAVFSNDVDTTEIYGSWSGQNNFYENPSLLVDGFHLSSRSTCIDAGIDSLCCGDMVFCCPSNDFEGDARPCSLKPDIGADEYTGMVGKADNYLSQQNTLSVYPNPFKGSAIISYNLHQRSLVRLEIFNISGQMVEMLVDEIQPEGKYSLNYSGSDLVPGLYYCVLRTEQGTNKAKIIKLQ